MKREPVILLGAISLYAILIIAGIAHHELWLDESHHWLLARDSASPVELWTNTRYEGHPILWNVLLYGITRLTANPVWMQALQAAVAISAACLFLRKAPFSVWVRIGFVFGYFMIFEYALISRNYMLGVLFLFAACDFWARKKALPFYLMLGLVFQTHMLFMVPAFAFFLVGVFHRRRSKHPGQELWLGIAIFVALAGIGIWQTVPPPDTIFFDPIDKLPLAERIVKGIAFPMKGWLALPDFRTIHFWNSNLLVNLSKPVASVLAVAAFALPLLLLRTKKALAFLYLTLLGGQIFFFITQRGATRFDGLAMIALIVSLWIERIENPVNRPALQMPVMYVLLGLQVCSGMMAWERDFTQPFSGSRQAADFIESHDLNRLPMVAMTCDATAIAAYLPEKIWFLCDGTYGSFCRWNNLPCGENLSVENTRSRLSAYVAAHGQAIFITQYDLDFSRSGRENLRMEMLFRSDETIVRNSGYVIYKISR